MTRILRRSSVPILLLLALLASPILAQPADIDKLPLDEAADAVLAAEKFAAGGGGPGTDVGPVPANDDCGAAIPLPVPVVQLGTTTGSTTDPEAIGVGFCGTTVTDPSAGVWYTVVGTGNTMTANTCNPGTNYDTKLTIYCQDCANLACVDGNDDSGGAPLFCSTISWCSELGATYEVFVHGFGAASGDFELDITDDGVACGGAVSCLPTGACCDDDGSCQITTEAECVGVTESYQGDGTTCFIPDGTPIMESAAPALPIPDSDPVGVSSTITITDSFAISDVNVDVAVTHTFIGDLIITLEHDGTVVTLWDRACSFENDMDVTIDDQAPALVCAQPTVGALNPESADGGPLSAFEGMDVFGDWTLTISDNAGADLGTLDTWGLEIDSGSPACPQPPVTIEIPTLSTIGLALMTLLLAIGAGALMLRRRSNT